MSNLARRRRVFHSEADFQHAFAWEFHSTIGDGDVRLEYRPLPAERVYLDLWFPAIRVAVELKYFTRTLDIEDNGEQFTLLDQSAQDVRRYDYLKDIERLERITKQRSAVRTGFAILLTNDRTYWRRPSRPNTVDAAFRLHHGRQTTKTMDWSAQAAAGTTKGREKPICLRRTYELNWQDYVDVGTARNGQFRFLAVQILR